MSDTQAQAEDRRAQIHADLRRVANTEWLAYADRTMLLAAADELLRLSRVEQALRGELDAANQHVKIVQAERDRIYHKGADAHRALIAVKADLLTQHVDGVNVWEHWLDEDARCRADAALSSSPEAQPEEGR